jgi:error-prone DNA polymerase
VYYHVRERRRLHDVMTAIRHKTTVDKIGRRGLPNGEHHLRPLVTLRRLYPPDLLETTVKIADACSFSLKELHYEYPEELVPSGLTPSEHLRDLTERGAHKRWPNGMPDTIRAQIERELQLIKELKYEHFFLTVADIVDYARAAASSAKAADRQPTPPCVMRCTSQKWIPYASQCSSSASSPRSVTRHPTLTSISSTSAARK